MNGYISKIKSLMVSNMVYGEMLLLEKFNTLRRIKMDFNDRIRIYYDAEFTGLHKDTTLISIGLVAETGSYFYAEFNDYDKSQLSDWHKENIINNLMFNSVDHHDETNKFQYKDHIHTNHLIKFNKDFIASRLLTWLNQEYVCSGKKIQFYTDCYAYDWVLLNDLICENGDALKIPEFIDYIPIDLSTLMYFKNVDPDVTREEFVDKNKIENLKQAYPFSSLNNYKHNCLWDAIISNYCFGKLCK